LFLKSVSFYKCTKAVQLLLFLISIFEDNIDLATILKLCL